MRGLAATPSSTAPFARRSEPAPTGTCEVKQRRAREFRRLMRGGTQAPNASIGLSVLELGGIVGTHDHRPAATAVSKRGLLHPRAGNRGGRFGGASRRA